jgi:hypothetical protein
MESISNFKFNLSFESWENVFDTTNGNEVNAIFNNFLNVYLRIFYCTFPQHKSIIRNKGKGWISIGIITSCRQKKELYLLYKVSNNIALKNYYRKYCKILANTIQLAKRLYYNKLITQSKTKTAWNVIRSLTAKQDIDDGELTLNIDGNLSKNPQVLASTFNKYFSDAVEETVSQILNQNTQDSSNDLYMQYLNNAFQQPFAPIIWKPGTGKEIYEISKKFKMEKIIWIRRGTIMDSETKYPIYLISIDLYYQQDVIFRNFPYMLKVFTNFPNI